MPAPESKRIIRGTQPPAPAPRPMLRAQDNPAPEAVAYYQNAAATMQKLIGNKHDEVYTDPATGRQCTANSCLSFASTVFDQAAGTNTVRTKQNLYNPEFTRTAEQQGWQQIPIDKAQAGDRFQSWQPVGSATANEFKVADLGGRQLIPGRVPVHMTVFGGWKSKPTPGNAGIATIYQDGHAYRAADSMDRPITANDWVAYRYVGRNPDLPPATPAAAAAPPAQPARVIRGTTASR